MARAPLLRSLRLALALSAAALSAQGAPAPIPTPPIPGPANLSPTPKVSLPSTSRPPVPAMTIPAPVTIDRLPIPPEAALTPAAPNDPAPALAVEGPLYRPPMVSPGAGNGAIEEASFALDPGASQIPDSAEGKLRMIADEMRQQPSSRLEVRVYSPTKAHTDSTARRLSLARFLAIRGVLTQNGVPASRVDGRALTSEATALNADRVELYLER